MNHYPDELKRKSSLAYPVLSLLRFKAVRQCKPKSNSLNALLDPRVRDEMLLAMIRDGLFRNDLVPASIRVVIWHSAFAAFAAFTAFAAFAADAVAVANERSEVCFTTWLPLSALLSSPFLFLAR